MYMGVYMYTEYIYIYSISIYNPIPSYHQPGELGHYWQRSTEPTKPRLAAPKALLMICTRPFSKPRQRAGVWAALRFLETSARQTLAQLVVS